MCPASAQFVMLRQLLCDKILLLEFQDLSHFLSEWNTRICVCVCVSVFLIWPKNYHLFMDHYHIILHPWALIFIIIRGK